MIDGLLEKRYLWKNQLATYDTINQSGLDIGRLFCYTHQLLYPSISETHGSGKNIILSNSYAQFMEDKWDIVHCEVKDAIDNLVNSNLLDHEI